MRSRAARDQRARVRACVPDCHWRARGVAPGSYFLPCCLLTPKKNVTTKRNAEVTVGPAIPRFRWVVMHMW